MLDDKIEKCMTIRDEFQQIDYYHLKPQGATRKPRPRKLPRIHKLEQCDWRGVMRLASRRVLEPGGAQYPQKIPCETPETDAR